MLGGEFSIMSQPGQGTMVKAIFPITNERKKK
jgi:signal transduction histidine kinase